MAWLLRRGEVLASLEVGHSSITWARRATTHGDHDTVLVSRPARVAHSVGARAPLDVAYLNRELVVVAMSHMAPFRVGRPHLSCHVVLRARGGAFERWRLEVGDQLEIKE
jgi:hypothetical protein